MHKSILLRQKEKGFTLLELLIVIAVIAILSTILIVEINPAETLKKSRDVQRISDLASLKTAIGAYATTASPVYLAGAASNANCETGAGAAGGKIYYSSTAGAAAITDVTLDGGAGVAITVAAASVPLTDGTGWLPVNLDGITGGSPISNMPVDPTNTISALAAVASTDLVYRYACNSTNSTFEVDSRLESTAFGPGGTDDRSAKDGGNNANLYEVGTNLTILGTGADF